MAMALGRPPCSRHVCCRRSCHSRARRICSANQSRTGSVASPYCVACAVTCSSTSASRAVSSTGLPLCHLAAATPSMSARRASMVCSVSKAVAAGLTNAAGWGNEASRASSLPPQGNDVRLVLSSSAAPSASQGFTAGPAPRRAIHSPGRCRCGRRRVNPSLRSRCDVRAWHP